MASSTLLNLKTCVICAPPPARQHAHVYNAACYNTFSCNATCYNATASSCIQPNIFSRARSRTRSF